MSVLIDWVDRYISFDLFSDLNTFVHKNEETDASRHVRIDKKRLRVVGYIGPKEEYLNRMYLLLQNFVALKSYIFVLYLSTNQLPSEQNIKTAPG